MVKTLLLSIPWHDIHPILVNFTAALVPASVGSDVLSRATKNESLRGAAWWMLLYAAWITPLTALAGWFWKSSLDPQALPADIIGTHQWLGSSLALLFVIQVVWRGRFHFRGQQPNFYYLALAIALVLGLMYQGSLGGKMVFG